MFRRKLGRTHGQMARSELSDSFGHLRSAAAHAVAGTAGAIAPQADRAGRMAGRTADRAGRTADRAGRMAGRTADRAGRMAGRAGDRVMAVTVTPVVSGARSVASRGRRSRVLQQVTPRRWRGATGMDREFAGMTRKRWSMMIGGLVAAGAVAGAATALIRRRRAAEAATMVEPGVPATEELPVADAAIGLGTDAPTDAGHGPVIATADDRPGAVTAADAHDRTSDLIGTRRKP